jgi:hypothetical protein
VKAICRFTLRLPPWKVRLGVDVIYLLLDEADRQAQSEGGLRFVEEFAQKLMTITLDENTVATENPTDVLDDEDIHCTMVRNDMGRKRPNESY